MGVGAFVVGTPINKFPVISNVRSPSSLDTHLAVSQQGPVLLLRGLVHRNLHNWIH